MNEHTSLHPKIHEYFGEHLPKLLPAQDKTAFMDAVHIIEGGGKITPTALHTLLSEFDINKVTQPTQLAIIRLLAKIGSMREAQGGSWPRQPGA